MSFRYKGIFASQGRWLCSVVIWKIDLHLIIFLFSIFIFNILDRSTIASARFGDLQTDLHLTDTPYQMAVSIMVCYSDPKTNRGNLLIANLIAVCWLSA